ncbi:biopolymer transporter ExbB [Bacteroidota bacterium]|jgi:biopolymer transport protein ExbB|nr:biopolymer transporter ExbB [Bacteroidota bacterium]
MMHTLLQIIDSTQPLGPQTALQQTAVPATSEMTLFDLLMAGGPVMIPILICSVVAVYIIIERLIAINKLSKDPSNFMNNIRDYITSGNIDAAKALCKNTNNPVARMIEKGISRLGKPLPDIEKAIENVGNIEVVKMERGLSALATCASAAPMLGFLGTVTGMVRAFYDMNMEYQRTHESINIGVLSSGMYEAMVTTVAGLVVGIIALVCYNILSAMIKKVIFKMESSSIEFLDLLEEPVK